MKKFLILSSLAFLMSNSVFADSLNISGITGSFFSASGTLSSLQSETFNSDFTTGTTSAEAQSYTLTPPSGQNYTSMYIYGGGSYGGDFASNGTNLSSSVSMIQTLENFTMSTAQEKTLTNNTLAANPYDFLSFEFDDVSGTCGSSVGCSNNFYRIVENGYEISLMVALSTNWTTGGVLPNPFDLSSRVGTFLSVQDFDSNGNVIGQANGIVTGLNITSTPTVPLPSAIWLFGSVLVGFLGLNRGKNIQK